MTTSADGLQSIRRSLDRLGRNTLWMALGVAGSAVLQYALYFCVARYLGAAEYGAFSLVLTAAVLAAPFAETGTAVALVRQCAAAPERLPVVLGASLSWRLLLYPVVGTGAWLLLSASGHGAAAGRLLLPLLAAAAFDGSAALASAAFQAREQMAHSAGLLLLRNVARAVAFVAALACGCDARGLALLYAVGSGVAAAVAWRTLLRTTAVRLWPSLAVLRTAVPFGIAILAVGLHAQVDVLLLGWLRELDEVGRYHAAARFVVVAQLVPQVVAMASAPLRYKLGARDAGGVTRVCESSMAALGGVAVLGALVLAAGADTWTALLLGPQWQGCAVLVALLAPALVLRYLSSPLGDALVSVGGERVLSMSCCIALLGNVAANLVLIPAHGAAGAVLATLGSEALYLLLLARASRALGIVPRIAPMLLRAAVVASAVVLAVHAAVPPLPAAFAGVLAYTIATVAAPLPAERRLLRLVPLPGTRAADRRSVVSMNEVTLPPLPNP